MNQFFVMMKMNFTTKQRRISVNNTNTNLQQSQTNYELNQACNIIQINGNYISMQGERENWAVLFTQVPKVV